MNCSEVCDLQDLLREILEVMTMPGSVHLFRGQGDSSWLTIPTLHRRLINAGYSHSEITEDLVREYEMDLICEAHGAGFYLGNRLSTMIKLQHFGGSTRLLDVTRDPFVALWFATGPEHGDRDGSVTFYRADPGVVANSGRIDNWDSLSGRIPPGRAIVYFPHREEERVKAQNAGFISATLGSFLAEGSPYMDGSDQIEVSRTIIPARLKAKVREYLIGSRGFSPYSLFPDFEGFAAGNTAARGFPRSRDRLYDGSDGLFPTRFAYPHQ